VSDRQDAHANKNYIPSGRPVTVPRTAAKSRNHDKPMKTTSMKTSLAAFAILTVAAFAAVQTAQAHCDGLDGPVVKAAQKALSENNVNLVLIWVQKEDEPEIKQVFDKTLAVRKLNAEARDLADRYFFETLVRIHRAREGAPYTGLKPAGRDLGPAIPAGDKALESGDLDPVLKLLSEKMEGGLRDHFKEVTAKKKFDRNDVEAGRAFVKSYVEYIHYIEGLYEAVISAARGHYPEADSAARSCGETRNARVACRGFLALRNDERPLKTPY